MHDAIEIILGSRGSLTDWKNVALELNRQNSNFKPGIFKDEGTFEGVLSKYCYYETDLDYILEVFISLQYCHVFHDGNKRTSLGLFLLMLATIDYNLFDDQHMHEELIDQQIFFIEHSITQEEFKQYILERILQYKK